MPDRDRIISKIFEAQNDNGCWKLIPESDRHYPVYLHYVPTFRATLWTLILLADIGYDKRDNRVLRPLTTIQDHFFDKKSGIYSIGEDHFPIPCLNGNMMYLDAYFNGSISGRSLKALDFFCENQRFDDGSYSSPKNTYCSNTRCYGKHTCYWGIVKLLKGISFIPQKSRSASINGLAEQCIRFILLHKVCFSSHHSDRIMTKHIDKLTFPTMYWSDFLEILWLLKREKVRSADVAPAIELLKSKRTPGGAWNLERKLNNLVTSVGAIDSPNRFITGRAEEVIAFYG